MVTYNASVYTNPRLSPEYMKRIRYGLGQGIIINNSTLLGYSNEQINVITQRFVKGIDASKYANVNIQSKEMKRTRIFLTTAKNESQTGWQYS